VVTTAAKLQTVEGFAAEVASQVLSFKLNVLISFVAVVIVAL
jgi:hypothetical protein